MQSYTKKYHNMSVMSQMCSNYDNGKKRVMI